MSEQFNFHKVLLHLDQVKKELPPILANQAQRFFANTWQTNGLNGSWEGKEWETPKRRIEGTPEYKYPKRGLQRTRATLVKSGALRRAVAQSVRLVSFEKIELVVGIPYAAYHNEGTDKIPQRQFMGHGPTLEKKQIEKIEQYINKIWQG